MPGVGVRPAGGYFGPLHPWLTPIEESDGMLHPFPLSEEAFEGRLAPVKACGLAHRDYITSTDPKLNSLVALPNEVLCHVLGYWEPTLPRLLDLNPNFYDSDSDGESDT